MSDDLAASPPVAPTQKIIDETLQKAATIALSPTVFDHQQTELMWYLATRRDALLLLFLVGATLAWTWERGALAALAGSLFSAFVFGLMLRLIQQSLNIPEQLWNAKKQEQNDDSKAELVSQWLIWLLLPVGLATSAMMARAAWLGLGVGYLSAMLTLLTGSWQIWLYLWITTASEPQGETRFD
jgi:hypothetical protein